MTTPRTRRPAQAVELERAHNDIQAAASELRRAAEAMNNLSQTLQPLAAHVPTIVEMANAWKTGQAVGRTAKMVGGAIKWAGGIPLALALLWAGFHAKWLAALGVQP